MASFNLTSNSTTAQALTSGESGIIPEGVSLAVTGAAAVTGSGTSNSLTVFGTLVSMSGSAYDFNGTSTAVTLGGYVAANSADAIHAVASNSIRVVNSGTVISNSQDAFDLRLTNAATPIRITFNNSGMAIAGSDGLVLQLFGGSANIMNSGVLSGTDGFGIALDTGTALDDATGTVHIVNTGTIAGGSGSINGENNALVIDNSGTLAGTAFLSQRGDVYYGGLGRFQGEMHGRDGDDAMFGGVGAETFFGENGAETVAGGGGDDAIFGGSGRDLLRGGEGDDEIRGGSQADSIHGGSGDDRLFGDSGKDTLWGKAGDDTLNGGGSDDELYGGHGEDVLIGGAGRDIMTGGHAADHFVFLNAGDSGTGPSADVITDFERGTDLIDLAGVSNQTIGFAGTGAFIGGGTASLRYSVNGAGKAIITVDTDGNGTADMRIDLLNTATLTASDFIL
jgi:Ca2+-binding RTX toxin-like protein